MLYSLRFRTAGADEVGPAAETEFLSPILESHMVEGENSTPAY